jgi:hypothetical protein
MKCLLKLLLADGRAGFDGVAFDHEIWFRFADNTEEFYSALRSAMAETNEILNRFTHEAERLISHHLVLWGFKRENVIPSPASPESQL